MIRTAFHRRPPAPAARLALPLLIAGCAAGTSPDAPSLLPRAIEARTTAEPVVTVPVATPDPALDARIADRVAALNAAIRAYDAAQGGLSARITRARDAAQGSDRWLDAQSAYGELQQLRTAGDSAMVDLESLAIDRASTGAPPYPPLDRAIAAGQVPLEKQVATENRLRAILPN